MESWGDTENVTEMLDEELVNLAASKGS